MKVNPIGNCLYLCLNLVFIFVLIVVLVFYFAAFWFLKGWLGVSVRYFDEC